MNRARRTNTTNWALCALHDGVTVRIAIDSIPPDRDQVLVVALGDDQPRSVNASGLKLLGFHER